VSLRLAALVALTAQALVPTVAFSAPESARAVAPVVIQSLSYEMQGEGLAVTLRISAPAPRFSLSLPSEGGSEAVLAVPEATSGLQSEYNVDTPLLAKIRVVPGRGGAPIELHFLMGQSTLAGVEQTSEGMRLRFMPRSGPADGADPARIPEYKVGTGDKLEISVFGHDDLSKIVEVRGDGTINYPLIGDLQVTGKSVSQIDDELTRILGKDYLVDPQVNVDVREYQSQWVTIIGEVRTPGQYVLKRDMRLIDLLAAAGGATKEAGTQILITRRAGSDGAPRQVLVDRELLLSRDKTDGNPLLVHGDIVSIGEKQAFYIRGEVSKPGMYYLESGLTLMNAISVAGGLTQFANRKDIQLLREDGEHHERRTVNLKAIEDGKKEDVPLRPNDTIIVPRRVF